MEKYGNTFAPQQRVVKVDSEGTKIASYGVGTVVEADPDTGLVRVKWAGGDTELVSAESLSREDG